MRGGSKESRGTIKSIKSIKSTLSPFAKAQCSMNRNSCRIYLLKATMIETLLGRLKPDAKSLCLFSLILLRLKRRERKFEISQERIETGNGALCVFRKRGGAANTGPARVTELHLTQFPAYIAIISSRGETARFRSKPANDDRGICVLLYILIVLSLFANRRPEQRRWNYSYFFEDRSREFIPLFFLFLSSPFPSPRFKSFSFVSNRRRGKSFFRRSVFLSILLVLSFPSFVDNLVRGTFFFLFSLLHGKISELRLDFTLMERDIGGIREKKLNAKTLTITFRGRETF